MSTLRTKIDSKLGDEIHAHLLKLGIETPTIFQKLSQSDHDKIEKIKGNIKEIWETLGMDLSDDSLLDTPNRIAKMMIQEQYYGLLPSNFPKITVIENKFSSELVIEKDISIMSNCEHHGIVMDGLATIAYIPKTKVLGLSKINRIADYFARRPTVQERLTNQIWHTLSFILGTEDIAVYIDAVHYCVKSRGAADASSHTITNKLGGAFMSDAAARAEFMSIARSGCK